MYNMKEVRTVYQKMFHAFSYSPVFIGPLHPCALFHPTSQLKIKTLKQSCLQTPKGRGKKLLYGLWTSLFTVIIGMTSVLPHFLSKVKCPINTAAYTLVRAADSMFSFSPRNHLKIAFNSICLLPKSQSLAEKWLCNPLQKSPIVKMGREGSACDY